MIRIKQKTGPSKPKKMKKATSGDDDKQNSKKNKKNKKEKPVKPKLKRVKKSGKISKPKKQHKPGQFVLRRTDNDNQNSRFPTSIDLDNQIYMLPKPDTQMNLTDEVKDMLKDADMGFNSISGVLETGDEEMGADEIRKSMQPKKKAYSGLPGWGNWANSKTMTQEIPAVDPKRKKAEMYRKKVHIEKDLPENPHFVTEVPFPFVSKEDYERSIATNLGPEFASRKLIRVLSESKKKVEYECDETWSGRK